MKKILCLIDSLGAGGAQRQLVGLARFLKERAYDVTVAYYHDEPFYQNELQSDGVHCDYIKKASNTRLRIWYLTKYIRRQKPDTIIAYLEVPSICACIAKMFSRRVRLIVSERSTTQHISLPVKIRFNLFRFADYIVPNAYTQTEIIKNNYPFLSHKVVTIPNFVDLQYFSPDVNKKRGVLPEIMVAASIWPLKNVLALIEAAAKLKNKGFSFLISWYGKDVSHISYFNECQERINELGLNDYIQLKEKTSRIRDKYQEADYFCLPSFYEGTPNVICEAMACGLPVACSDVCDNSRYVTEGINGFLFNPYDTDSIAKALEQLLISTDKQYYDYCNQSRYIAEQVFSKNSFINSYLKLI